MSVAYSEQNQGYTMNSSYDLFPTSTPTKPDRVRDAPVTAETPTPKRRRGRPSKCPQVDGQPSPAEHLSAAVMKQGTPKASAPLMRVSPLKNKKASENSPRQRKVVNPSPKGGILLQLDSGKDTKKAKAAGKTKKNAFYSAHPSRISLATQHNIHSITNDTLPDTRMASVNPTLLLSSPISSSKINEINRNRVPFAAAAKATESLQGKMNPPTNFPSSPMTPNSLNSSCFSSIMRSSPLYHGYYAQESSPGTSILASSPMRLHMKPIELSEVKEEAKPTKKPRQRSISPTTKEEPEDPEEQSCTKKEESEEQESLDNSQYKITFGVDEYGQAVLTKVKIPKSTPAPVRPHKLTRHQSLAALPSHTAHISRSASLSCIPTLKSSELFIEPSKMSTETSFFNSISDELGFETISTPPHQEEFNFAEDLSTTSEDLLMEDEGTDYDARSALIKMVRRSM